MTRAQLRALYRLSRRSSSLTFRQLYNQSQPTFGCDGAIVVNCCKMWICIELDGYTHS